ncbi:pq loop repeat protein [Zymoseptoria brevis]|uniref:Pq loop repeat protein n=1 Tax=Zymoseptoria brevis TaxID=1047168 RepID=A0A0F4G9K2_9PEZI|nr:pq loop repeat protein [Zymoseptoria brevis]
MSEFWSAIDIVARWVLVVLSAASFVPQLYRILARGKLEGISPWTILFGQLVATHSLAMADSGDFAVVWICQLALFCSYMFLPPFDSAASHRKVFFALIYLCFATITLYPTINGTFLPRGDENDWGKWRFMYWSLLISPMVSIGPIMQLIGIYAGHIQVRVTHSHRSPGSLHFRALPLQAVVFTLVGASMIFRIKIAAFTWEENPALPPAINTPLFNLIRGLPIWYLLVGWATVNNLIFSISQGVLWRVVRSQMEIGGATGEREPLLGRNA